MRVVENERDAEEAGTLAPPATARQSVARRQPSEPPVSSSDAAVARRCVTGVGGGEQRVAGPPCQDGLRRAHTTTTRSRVDRARARSAPAARREGLPPRAPGPRRRCTSARSVEAAPQLRRHERRDLPAALAWRAGRPRREQRLALRASARQSSSAPFRSPPRSRAVAEVAQHVGERQRRRLDDDRRPRGPRGERLSSGSPSSGKRSAPSLAACDVRSRGPAREAAAARASSGAEATTMRVPEEEDARHLRIQPAEVRGEADCESGVPGKRMGQWRTRERSRREVRIHCRRSSPPESPSRSPSASSPMRRATTASARTWSRSGCRAGRDGGGVSEGVPQVAAGAHTFVQFACVQCHGFRGRGGVDPAVPALATAGQSPHGRSAHAHHQPRPGRVGGPEAAVHAGLGRGDFEATQVADLVAYIRAGAAAGRRTQPVDPGGRAAVAGAAPYVRSAASTATAVTGCGVAELPVAGQDDPFALGWRLPRQRVQHRPREDRQP
mgnify:CR=1 FL=1